MVQPDRPVEISSAVKARALPRGRDAALAASSCAAMHRERKPAVDVRRERRAFQRRKPYLEPLQSEKQPEMVWTPPTPLRVP